MDSGSNRMGGFGAGGGGGIGSGRFKRQALLGSGRTANQAAGFFQRGTNQPGVKKNILGQQDSPSIFKRGIGVNLEKIKAGD